MFFGETPVRRPLLKKICGSKVYFVDISFFCDYGYTQLYQWDLLKRFLATKNEFYGFRKSILSKISSLKGSGGLYGTLLIKKFFSPPPPIVFFFQTIFLKEIKINGGSICPLLIGWNHTKNNPSKAYPKDPKHQFSIKSQLYSFYKLYNGYYNSTKLVKHHIVCVDGRKKQKMTSKHAFYAKKQKNFFFDRQV